MYVEGLNLAMSFALLNIRQHGHFFLLTEYASALDTERLGIYRDENLHCLWVEVKNYSLYQSSTNKKRERESSNTHKSLATPWVAMPPCLCNCHLSN